MFLDMEVYEKDKSGEIMQSILEKRETRGGHQGFIHSVNIWRGIIPGGRIPTAGEMMPLKICSKHVKYFV